MDARVEVASLKSFAMEVDIMHGSRHPNLVSLLPMLSLLPAQN